MSVGSDCKKVSSQNPQESTCVGVSLLLKLPVMKNIFERLLPHKLHIFLYKHFVGRSISYMELGRGVWEGAVISQVWYRF